MLFIINNPFLYVSQTMDNLIRFGIAINQELLTKFDKHLSNKGYTNRSEAIRDLIRESLIQEEWKTNEYIIGVISFVYNHHIPKLTEKLVDLQHHSGEIVSSMHIHLNESNCLEIIVVRGKSKQVEKLAGKMFALKGVKHGKLIRTTTARKV